MYQPEGNPETAKLVIVGEAPARTEIIQGRPFVGLAGRVLNECMESAAILRSECYLTNVFDFNVKKGQGTQKANIYHPSEMVYNKKGEASSQLLWSSRGGMTAHAKPHIERLWTELHATRANVIIPMGGPALEAVCGVRGITKWRGSIIAARPPHGPQTVRKCVPALHPANALHGAYISRYIIRSDLERAQKECAFPEIVRPAYNFPMHLTFRQCCEWLKWLRTQKTIAPDIEVANRQVSCIAYAWSATDAVSIPYGMGGWTAEQEAILWILTAQLLEDETITKIFQNGAFDVQFLFQVHDILVQGPCEDTMIEHHLMFPDFRMGLAFLASLHTDQPYWKDMVKHGDIDKENG